METPDMCVPTPAYGLAAIPSPWVEAVRGQGRG
jgi:hypothetical protein